jgi:hypothetical protein
MARLTIAFSLWRDRARALWSHADAGIEILQAVILAAGLGLAAVTITMVVTDRVSGWLDKIPL